MSDEHTPDFNQRSMRKSPWKLFETQTRLYVKCFATMFPLLRVQATVVRDKNVSEKVRRHFFFLFLRNKNCVRNNIAFARKRGNIHGNNVSENMFAQQCILDRLCGPLCYYQCIDSCAYACTSVSLYLKPGFRVHCLVIKKRILDTIHFLIST